MSRPRSTEIPQSARSVMLTRAAVDLLLQIQHEHEGRVRRSTGNRDLRVPLATILTSLLEREAKRLGLKVRPAPVRPKPLRLPTQAEVARAAAEEESEP